MILLLGKNDLVEEYAREILKINMSEDIVYYPSVTTHHTELNKYVEIAEEEKPLVITTQSLEMVDVLLESNLDIKVITVKSVNGKIKTRELSKEKAWNLRCEDGIDLR